MSDLIITLDDGKELLNPKMKINKVYDYDTVTNVYNVEISFRENGGLYDHIRGYQFTNENLGGLEFSNVIMAVKTHPDIGSVPLILNDGTEV